MTENKRPPARVQPFSSGHMLGRSPAAHDGDAAFLVMPYTSPLVFSWTQAFPRMSQRLRAKDSPSSKIPQDACPCALHLELPLPPPAPGSMRQS